MGLAAHELRAGHGRSVHGAPPRRGGGPRDPLRALSRPARRHRHSVSLLSGVLSLLCVPQRNDGPRGATMARGSVSYTSGPVRGMSGGAYHSAVPGRRAHMPVVRGGVQSQLCPALQSLLRGALRSLRQLHSFGQRLTPLQECRAGLWKQGVGLLSVSVADR
jgi:hypothetical protein